MSEIESLNNWEKNFKEQLKRDLTSNNKEIMIYLINKKQIDYYKQFNGKIKIIYLPTNKDQLQSSDIRKLPSVFPLDTNIKIEAFNNVSNFVIGRFYNKVFICENEKKTDKIYIFFFLDKNDRLRQGYINIKCKERKSILYLLRNDISGFLENYVSDLNNDRKFFKNEYFDLFITEGDKYNEIENKIKENEKNNNYIINKKLNKINSKICEYNSEINPNNNYQLRKSGNYRKAIRPKKIIIQKKLRRASSHGEIRIRAFNNDPNLNLGIILPKNAVQRESIPGVIGLVDSGKCSMNSVLQCFSNLTKLRNALLDDDIFKELEKNKEFATKLSFSLAEVLKNLWQNLKIKIYNPWNFKELINDIQVNEPIKLIGFLLKKMNQELKNEKINNIIHKKNECNEYNNIKEPNYYFNKNMSLIEKEFCGIYNSSICYNCNSIQNNNNYFFYLSFNLEEVKKFLKNNYNIIRLLDCFDYSKNLNYLNSQYCNNCHNNTLFSENMILYCPPILIINLIHNFNNFKLVFEEQLNLIKYISSKETTYYFYELTGLISLYEGNYIAYCKNKRGWYKYNDSKVTKTIFSEIKANVMPCVLFFSQIKS